MKMSRLFSNSVALTSIWTMTLCRFYSSAAFTLPSPLTFRTTLFETASSTTSNPNRCSLASPASTTFSSCPTFHRQNHRVASSTTQRDAVRPSVDENDFSDDNGNNMKDNQKEDDSPKDEYSLSDAEMKWIEGRESSSSSSSSTNNPSVVQNQRTPEYNDDDYDGDTKNDNEGAGNVNIPKTGISVSDEMVALQTKENFVTRLVSLVDEDGYGGSTCVPPGVKAAKIETTVGDQIGEEPARYLVPLSPSVMDDGGGGGDAGSGSPGASDTPMRYALVDVPPFSEELADQIRTFMSSPLLSSKSDEKQKQQQQPGILSNILITSRDGIHYDESPAVYVTRKSDLISWKRAFPEAHIAIYRLDAPRECKELVSQVLDGYGPWGLGEETGEAPLKDDGAVSDSGTKRKEKKKNIGAGSGRGQGDGKRRLKFVETGRPLTRVEWSEEVQEQVLDHGMAPPDDNEENDDVDGLYTPEAIRAREEGKEILALYTPGHTYGSVTYIFPNVKICCSGYTIPLEDAGTEAASGSMAGPTMDYRGYITTNQGGMARQIESAQHLIDVYGDRFEAVLPSRGSPVCLPGERNGTGTDTQRNIKYRARIWGQLLNDYAELGKVYEQLGII